MSEDFGGESGIGGNRRESEGIGERAGNRGTSGESGNEWGKVR